MIPLLLIIIAAVSYFLGTLSSGRLLATYVLHKPLHTRGSGYVGYAAMAHAFGQKWGYALLGADILKSLVAVMIGSLLMMIPGDGFPVVGRLFAGFCLVLGDAYPFQFKFRGGKGVLPLMVALWLADWRVGLLATGVLIVLIALTQYMSLASLCACLTGVIAVWIFVSAEQMKGMCGFLVLFSFLAILWRHRGNILKLLDKKEPKINWGRRPENRIREDDF